VIRFPLRRFAIVTLAFAGLMATILPKPAAAEGTTAISCRASAIRITGAGPLAFLGTIEPVVSNSTGTVCANDFDGFGAPLVLPSALGAIGAVLTLTTYTQTASLHEGGALADGLNVLLTVPGGLPIIGVQELFARVTVTCHIDGTRPAGNRIVGTSTVLGLSINAVPVVVPLLGQGHLDIPLGVGTLHLNEKIRTAPGVTPHVMTQRALWLDAPGLIDVVIAEAVGDYHLP